MNINKSNIANAIHSVAKDHVVAVANDIYDESRELYQSTLNEGVGLYENNPEFVKVVTDFEGKILYAVRVNGDFYFGAGVPSQIQDLVNATLGTIDEKIAIIEAELLRLDDTKVDKEEGKSLIPTQYIQEVEDNPEFVKIVLDSLDKILYGVKANGDFMFGCGVPSQIQEKLDELGILEDNPEFIRVYLDKKGKILWGIKSDGSIYYGAGIPKQIVDYINNRIAELSLDEYEDIVAFIGELLYSDKTLQELLDNKLDAVPTNNPEYLQVTTDSDSKILQGIKFDGTSYIGGDLKVNGKASISGDTTVRGNVNLPSGTVQSIDNPEYTEVKVDSESKILEGITTDGIKKINIPVDNGAAIIETTDNQEFLEAKVDAEGKLIEGINKSGEKIFGVIPPLIKQYIDENMPVGGSGVQSIEYDDATGDMYATYDNESGVTDVSMDPNGDIYVEYETGV